MKAAPFNDDTPIHPVRDHDAARRAEIYRGLSLSFSYPDFENVTTLRSREWLNDFKRAIVQASAAIDQCELDRCFELVRDADNLGEQYSALFDVAAGAPQVSLLERRYSDDPEQQLWERLLRFYSHFGLDFSQGYAKEQPDHLVTQLSFMHYLCFLQATTAGDPAGIHNGQADFVERHLLPLATGIARRANSVAEENVYYPICKLLSAIISAEHDSLHGAGAALC